MNGSHTSLRAPLAGALSILVAACASSPPPADAGGDAAAPPSDTRSSPPDATLDATTPADGPVISADVPATDGPAVGDDVVGDAADARGPHPPPGTHLCGSGTVDAAMLASACAAFDPIMDLSIGGTKDCSAVNVRQLEYEVHCSATDLYVWGRFSGVASPTPLNCTRTFPLPDGGSLVATLTMQGWALYGPGGGAVYTDTAGGHRQLYGALINSSWFPTGSSTGGTPAPLDVTFEHHAMQPPPGGGAGRGRVAITGQRADCDGIPHMNPLYVLVAPVQWAAP